MRVRGLRCASRRARAGLQSGCPACPRKEFWTRGRPAREAGSGGHRASLGLISLPAPSARPCGPSPPHLRDTSIHPNAQVSRVTLHAFIWGPPRSWRGAPTPSGVLEYLIRYLIHAKPWVVPK